MPMPHWPGQCGVSLDRRKTQTMERRIAVQLCLAGAIVMSLVAPSAADPIEAFGRLPFPFVTVGPMPVGSRSPFNEFTFADTGGGPMYNFGLGASSIDILREPNSNS